MCGQLEECARMEAFYAQPGYDRLRRRMFDEIERGKESRRRVS
jgi:hypothetical protein